MMRTLSICSTLIFKIIFTVSGQKTCKPSLTTVSGSAAPNRLICVGDLIFSDEFDKIDLNKWQKENTLSGGWNNEFQWYATSNENSFSENGNLVINPTLMVDRFGDGILTGGEFNVEQFGPCTDADNSGCTRDGTEADILNPIISAKLQTKSQFTFKYGTVEFRAKLPAGDWLWPAVWMLPKDSVYGPVPYSGEIDLVEGRGNRHLLTSKGGNVGSKQVALSLHSWPESRFFVVDDPGGFVDDFHVYRMVWTPDHIILSVDGKTKPFYGTVPPYDQEFYFIINLAIGGKRFFSGDWINPGGKPWSNKSPHMMTEFWKGRGQWLPTWRLPDKQLQAVDYLRVWAQ